MNKGLQIPIGIERWLKQLRPEIPTFKWCGYEWAGCMPYGRRIHPEQPWMWYDDAQVLVEDGSVISLSIENKPTEIVHWDHITYKPTIATGTIRSIEAFDFGTFTAEVMLPKGYGLWPSFWLTGAGNWPPEIDLMEAWSNNDRYFRLFRAQPPYIYPSWRTTTNVHFNEASFWHNSIGSRNISIFKQCKNPAENWIEYKCVWAPDFINFYANGKLVRAITGEACWKLTNNLVNPENGYKMNVIFNIWCENPKEKKGSIHYPDED